jgi:hypothetical protein
MGFYFFGGITQSIIGQTHWKDWNGSSGRGAVLEITRFEMRNELSFWNHPVAGKEPVWSLAVTRGSLLLFEVFEGAVVSAGQFHDVPIRPQLKI